MSRKHPWNFKNRREQHKYMVETEKADKRGRHDCYNETTHTKERWRKAEYIRERDWLIKARLNGWIK